MELILIWLTMTRELGPIFSREHHSMRWDHLTYHDTSLISYHCRSPTLLSTRAWRACQQELWGSMAWTRTVFPPPSSPLSSTTRPALSPNPRLLVTSNHTWDSFCPNLCPVTRPQWPVTHIPVIYDIWRRPSHQHGVHHDLAQHSLSGQTWQHSHNLHQDYCQSLSNDLASDLQLLSNVCGIMPVYKTHI